MTLNVVLPVHHRREARTYTSSGYLVLPVRTRHRSDRTGVYLVPFTEVYCTYVGVLSLSGTVQSRAYVGSKIALYIGGRYYSRELLIVNHFFVNY